jgi:hypothetical protein
MTRSGPVAPSKNSEGERKLSLALVVMTVENPIHCASGLVFSKERKESCSELILAYTAIEMRRAKPRPTLHRFVSNKICWHLYAA